jgi:hypothetical protein
LTHAKSAIEDAMRTEIPAAGVSLAFLGTLPEVILGLPMPRVARSACAPNRCRGDRAPLNSGRVEFFAGGGGLLLMQAAAAALKAWHSASNVQLKSQI